MRLIKVFFSAAIFLALANLAFAANNDDTIPAVKNRVSRISYISGDIEVKRYQNEEWEKATLNLPLLEGDQIATDSNSRAEIQFDSRNYLRVSENSLIKIATLRDEGIAVSVPQGSVSLRILSFDPNRTYFEIDAPKTTVSIQQAGLYRIDAGNSDQSGVRITVTDSGLAKVYFDNSAFNVKNGRSAKLYLDGALSGEWETSDASKYTDDFGAWALERDRDTSRRLQKASYDKYYDRDIYGAEDLDEHGEWIYTKKYGYVWRPYSSSIRRYDDWSPYRYGHWRWVAPFGWTWINDEPWGWATYHHGRWIYVDDNWCWTPYGYYRNSRSWWRPAIVIITWNGSSICWYPASYHHRYYDYNHHNYGHYGGWGNRGNTTIINNNTTIIVNPTPTPNPNGGQISRNPDRKPRDIIPPGGVVSVPAGKFGRGGEDIRRYPANEAAKLIERDINPVNSPPFLPPLEESKKRSESVSVITPPIFVNNAESKKVGAMERDSGRKLDDTLRNDRAFEGRKPRQPDLSGGSGIDRDTGAVSRPVFKSDPGAAGEPKPLDQPGRRPRPREEFPATGSGNNGDNGERKPRSEPQEERKPRDTPPIYQPQEERKPPRQEERKPRESPPIFQPPQEERKPRYDPPPPQEERKPRYDPPPPQEERKPRYDPPPAPREEPRQEPRQEPKPEPRPAPPPKQDEPRPSPKEPPAESKKDNRRR